MASSRERVDFLQEIDTMKKVAKGNSPYVVNMVGCVTIQEPLCLITEFIKYGDLLSYLKTIRNMVRATETSLILKYPNEVEISQIPCIDTFSRQQ